MTVFSPRDLAIHIRAVEKPQHVLNGGPKDATFPGWFLTVQENAGYELIAGPSQLTMQQVMAITLQIDRYVYGDERVSHAATRCDKAMKDELRRQLEVAEKAAARIPHLKRLLNSDG
jgi:citrate lyase synthetase